MQDMLNLLLDCVHFKLLSILIKIVQKNAKHESCFWNLNTNFELIAFLPLRFHDTDGDVYVENKGGID